jgi:uncharacterized protein involved in exopolysaccharide biosynthesis
MEEGIDLRAYVQVLFSHWKLIVGLAVAAAVIALVVTLMLPPIYEADAKILVTESLYRMTFDPRLTTEYRRPAYRALPTLAISDGILRRVIEDYRPSPEAGIENWNLVTLQEMVEATPQGDQSLVALKVRARTARDAADIANVWAKALVARGNEIYSDTSGQVAFFEEQFVQARKALDEADQALIEFEARSQVGVVNAELESLNQAQIDYLASQRMISYLVEDIQGLRELANQRLQAGQPAGGSASLADDLTALLLQIKAFNALDAGDEAAIQIQIDSSESLSDRSPAEQVAFLDSLAGALQDRSAEIDERLAELEPQILETQEERQALTVESERLLQAQELAVETYETLSRKVDEARILAQEEYRMFLVGSEAEIPEYPVGPNKKLNTLVGGMLGLLVGVVLAVLIEFWRAPAHGNASAPETAPDAQGPDS